VAVGGMAVGTGLAVKMNWVVAGDVKKCNTLTIVENKTM